MSIRSKIQALITAANAKTGESDTTLTDAVQTLVDGYGHGGASIEQGYEITSVNSSGSVTSVDIYGNVPTCCFGFYNNPDSVGRYMTSARFMGGTGRIGYGAFQRCGLTSIEIPDSVNSIGTDCFRASSMIHYVHENARNLYGYGNSAISALTNCSGAIETIQLGAIGKPLTALYYQFMTSRTYSYLTLTIYCTGANVDSFLTDARRAITAGTIVFKASESTEYNGTSYAAGDTILTSEVESTS